MTTLATIPIDMIEFGSRLRDISEAQVEALGNSIADVGILNPVTVYARQIVQNGILVDGYGLVAGAHRVEACKRLGLVDVPAHVVQLGELERQIAECDENLCSTVLSKTERALFTKRRKDAYEALHPEAKHGAIGNGREKSCQVGDSTSDRFTADTAAKTGQSERAVQRDAERGSKISMPALALVKGSKLDNGTYLDSLKGTPKSDQVNKVKADLSSGISRRFKQAPDPIHEDDAKERWLATGIAWWNKAPKEWREEFLGRVDTPVFDRGAA